MTEDKTEYAPLIEVLVAFYRAVEEQHLADAKDPAVRERLRQALDAILDGRAKFKKDARPKVEDPPPPPHQPRG